MVSKKRKMDRSEKNIEEYGTSRMRKNTESQGCLPDDLLIIILLYLPADLLYNVMRFICRHWYNIIQSPSFISSHLKNSTTGLFLAHIPPRWKSDGKKRYILKPTCGGVEVKDLNLKCASEIHASCNGLVFILGPNKVRGSQCPCYIANLATKQQLPLPLIPNTVNCRDRWYIAYTPTSKVYKVFYSGEKKLLIITVGVDKGWRKVNISELISPAKTNTMPYCSIVIRGFLYWAQKKEVPFILCFDMETETFRRIPLPPQSLVPQFNNRHSRVITMGNSLCWYKFVDFFTFEFWLLKDPETGIGKWEKLLDINLIDQICVISKLLKSREIDWLTPHGWLNEELLVLGASERIVFYNVKTGEYHTLKELNVGPCNSYAHVESLVPLNNLSLVMTNEHPRKIRRSTSKFYSEDNMRAEFEQL